MSAWKVASFERAKAHLVAEELFRLLVEDMAARGHALAESGSPPTEPFFDLPGMAHVDRPIEKVSLAGIVLRVPSEDIRAFTNQLRGLPRRRFAGGQEYYKLHGNGRCWVLSPEQRVQLMATLSTMEPSATRRSDDFYRAIERERARRRRAT